MHKSALALIMVVVLVVSGCTPSISSLNTTSPSGNSSFSSQYAYNRDMKNPGTQSTENLMMMQNGFAQTQKITYKLTQENIDQLSASYCVSSFPASIYADEVGAEVGKINKSDLQVGKEFTLEIPYKGA